MSTNVFPTLAGQGWSITRTSKWSTQIQTAVSGKEGRAAFWSYPRYQWELVFNFLRIGQRGLQTYTELQQLFGLFNTVNGSFDSFLYQDQDDNAVTGQAIGQGNGVATNFQLVRAFAGYIEPVLAPNIVSNVYINGVVQNPATYTVNGWATTTPGLIVFSAPPGAGLAITADFSYYFPCRFLDDTLDFEKFMATLYTVKSVKFLSLKN